MKIQKVDLLNQNLLIELFKTDRNVLNTDYYIDRGTNFWATYFWASPEDCIAYGAFVDGTLVGMTCLVLLPIDFHQGRFPVYLNTDFFIHHKFRKGLAGGRLLNQLQIATPVKGMVEVGVENQPHFLDRLEQVSDRHGNQAFWGKTTILNQNIILKKCLSSELQLTIYDDKTSVYSFWKKRRESNYQNPHWQFKKELDLSISEGIKLAVISDGENQFSCLFVDKSNYQKIRWNGIQKIPIERYRRRLESQNIHFKKEDEFKFLNICFCETTSIATDFLIKTMNVINNYAFDNFYFSWNVRDFNFPFGKNPYFESVKFERRISVVNNIDDKKSFDISVFYNERNLLESVFL